MQEKYFFFTLGPPQSEKKGPKKSWPDLAPPGGLQQPYQLFFTFPAFFHFPAAWAAPQWPGPARPGPALPHADGLVRPARPGQALSVGAYPAFFTFPAFFHFWAPWQLPSVMPGRPSKPSQTQPYVCRSQSSFFTFPAFSLPARKWKLNTIL